MNTNFKFSFLLLFLLVICQPIFAQKEEIKQSVTLDGLPPSYTDSDTIRLSITNHTDEMLYVAISIEQQCEHGWEVVVNDIFSKGEEKHKARNTKLLLEQDNKVIELPVDKMNIRIHEPDASYRFRLDVLSTPFDIKEKLYSDTFSFQ